MSVLFDAGALVDIVVPGVKVVDHGPTTITFAIPGVPDRVHCLPVRDERAREVVEVTHAVPNPVAGEVYLVAGAADRRLFAFNHRSGDVALLDPVDSRSYWPENAVAKFGQLHLSIPMPDPTPAVARAVAPVLTNPAAPPVADLGGLHFTPQEVADETA